jgi:hypothetical protein
MSNDFKIKPAAKYNNPSYPTKNKKQTSFFKTGTASLLLSAGITLMASSCTPPIFNQNTNNENNNILDGVAVECMMDDLTCGDGGTIGVCINEDGYEHFDYKECNDYCFEEFGPDYSAFGVCDMNNHDNPCDCQYDVMDGIIAQCDEGDFYCTEDDSISICDASGMHVEKTCDEYCEEEWGSDLFISGSNCSDSTTDEPCDCYYGVLDGAVAECTVDDIICVSDKTLGVCEDGYTYSNTRCEEICANENNSTSAGCDTENKENPCLCEEE